MIDPNHNRDKFGMNSVYENSSRDNNKRLRAGSVSGRLRYVRNQMTDVKLFIKYLI